MKLTKSSTGRFAKLGENIQDGEIVKIVDSGTVQEGDFGLQHIFKILCGDGEVRNLSLNATSRNYLIDAYGDDTDGWRDKQIRANIVKQNISGKFKNVLYATAPDQVLGDEIQ